MTGRQIMTADEIRRATIRISHEIVEKQAGTTGLALVGIQRRGVPLAGRIACGRPKSTRASIAARIVRPVYRTSSTRTTVEPFRSNGRSVPLTTGCWATSDRSSR
jgi:pyrimidine operon attenuation protein/uracil phosphoribosyltransferase